MCWIPLCTRQKTKANKIKTQHNMWDTTTHKIKDEDKQIKKKTQYVLDITMHKTKDEDK